MKQLLLTLSLIVFCQSSGAQDSKSWSTSPTGTDFRKKAEAKKGSRWTLQEWLEQKDKSRMMDLWLAMYKPSPYEFYLQGSVDQYDFKTNSVKTDAFRSYSGAIAFYALIVGLEAQYENNAAENYQDLAGIVNLRIAGNAVQSTHLSINYGSKRRDLNSQNLQIYQTFTGANLEIYLNKSMGLHGSYRYYMPTTGATLGDITGQRSEAGLFFDIDYIRLYGNWYSDYFNTTLPSVITNERTGFQTGIRFFF